MTTVAQLIAHLQTLPQDAEVQCLREAGRAWDSFVEWTDLKIEDHINVIDLRDAALAHLPRFGKVIVEIGDK